MSLFGSRYADGQALEIAGVVVRLRVSARARRISLRLDRLNGEAVAVAPSARHLADAAAFARSRQRLAPTIYGWCFRRVGPTACLVGPAITAVRWSCLHRCNGSSLWHKSVCAPVTRQVRKLHARTF